MHLLYHIIFHKVVDPASAENFTIEAGPFTVTPRVFDIEVRNVSGEFPVVEGKYTYMGRDTK